MQWNRWDSNRGRRRKRSNTRHWYHHRVSVFFIRQMHKKHSQGRTFQSMWCVNLIQIHTCMTHSFYRKFQGGVDFRGWSSPFRPTEKSPASVAECSCGFLSYTVCTYMYVQRRQHWNSASAARRRAPVCRGEAMPVHGQTGRSAAQHLEVGVALKSHETAL